MQLVGKEPINLETLPVDYLAVAAHKLHGPKGSGALYVKRTAPFAKLIMGASQEMDLRAGLRGVNPDSDSAAGYPHWRVRHDGTAASRTC